MKHPVQKIGSHPLFFLLCGFMIVLSSLFYQLSEQKKMKTLGQTALYLKKKEAWMKERKKIEESLTQQLKTANRDYVEQEIETLSLMQKEIEKLEALAHSDPHNRQLSERLEFLTGPSNQLAFREHNFQRLDQYQEVEVIQKHPVEMNTKDLKNFLAKIENIPIFENHLTLHPPFFLIKKLELIKKPLDSHEEAFVVSTELIKYELVK